MYFSIKEAVGTGSAISVAVPPYLDRSHIKVYVDFLPTEAFEWINNQTISVIAPLNRKVQVVRRTSPDERLTRYFNGTSLPGETLEVDSKQAFFLAQEAFDMALQALEGTAGRPTHGGVILTTQGIKDLLLGQIEPSMLELALREQIELTIAPASVIGSPAWLVAQEAAARLGAVQAEYEARVTALANEAAQRAVAIAAERTLRENADGVLASQVSTVAAEVGSVNAAVQSEQTARIGADSAIASDIDTIVAYIDDLETGGSGPLADRVAAVEVASEATADLLDGVRAMHTIKVQARSDGKQALAGIGLLATASNSAPTQSEMVFLADKFTFVPSAADINAVPQPLLVMGLVNGINTLVVPQSRMGDKLVSARMIIDGELEARHFKVNSITADVIDTRGLSIRDLAGNVILSAGNFGQNIDGNLVGNPNGAVSAVGWWEGAPHLVSEPFSPTRGGGGAFGTNITHMRFTGRDNHYGTPVQVSVGDAFSFRFRSVPEGGGTSDSYCALGFVGYDGVGNHTGSYFAATRSGSTPGDVYTEGSFTVPSGVAMVRPCMFLDNPHQGTTYGYYCREIEVRRRITVDLVGRLIDNSAGLRNNQISLNANGTINGAGGGGVTIGGLGYTGDLNANRTTDTSQLSDGAGLGQRSLWSGVADDGGRPQNGATVGATFGVNIGGQITPLNAFTFIQAGAIVNALIGQIIQSDTFESGASGWQINKAGNIEVNNLTARGMLNGGAFSGYGWPGGGGTGFHLGPSGLLMGNYYNGKYVQITAEGNFYAPGFKIENGVMTIDHLNVIKTFNVAGGAITNPVAASGDGAVSVLVYDCVGGRPIIVICAVTGGPGIGDGYGNAYAPVLYGPSGAMSSCTQIVGGAGYADVSSGACIGIYTPPSDGNYWFTFAGGRGTVSVVAFQGKR